MYVARVSNSDAFNLSIRDCIRLLLCSEVVPRDHPSMNGHGGKRRSLKPLKHRAVAERDRLLCR